MSVNYGRVVKALDGLSEAQLSSLRGEINRRLDDTGESYKQGVADGWNGCLTFMDEYFTPANNANTDLAATMGVVWGLSIGARGDTRRELLRFSANILAYAISDVDLHNGYFDEGAKKVAGIEAPSMFDLSPAFELRDAIKRDYTGEDQGKSLTTQLNASIPTQSLLDFRVNIPTPGADKRPEITFIANEIRAMADELNIPTNTRENESLLGRRLYERLYREQDTMLDDNTGKSLAWEKLKGCVPKNRSEPDKGRLRDVVHNALVSRPVG